MNLENKELKMSTSVNLLDYDEEFYEKQYKKLNKTAFYEHKKAICSGAYETLSNLELEYLINVAKTGNLWDAGDIM